MKRANPSRRRAQTKTERKSYDLRLYVAGQTQKSITALANLRRICEDHLPGQYEIEIVDLLKNPALARGDQILAIPTLVRKLPRPIRKIIGDLSDTDNVLVGLDLRPSGNSTSRREAMNTEKARRSFQRA